jgi:hypothetical protein
MVINPAYNYGKALNPCKDCKIFMLKKAKEFANKKGIEIIATGEVLGQRGNSQTKDGINIINKNLDFEVLRPLSAKRLKQTTLEKENKVNRESLFGISGRRREQQKQLAKKYKITFSNPDGGCLLCDEKIKSRLKSLIENNAIDDKNWRLLKSGRHFLMNSWIVVARDEKESTLIESFKNSIKSDTKTPAVYYKHAKDKENAKELQEAFKNKNYKKFEKYKLS